MFANRTGAPPPRREFLKRAGSTLLGAGASSTLLTSGCAQKVEADPIKVGILHSQTGTMAISETSLRDIELFAIEEINAAGGLLGRKIQPVVEDPRSRNDDLFPRRARKLLAEDGVSVLFGCWSSVGRKAVVPVVEEFGSLLFYPVQYEGNECSPNVIYTGSVPNQQILPALDWMRSLSGGRKRRFFLIGGDLIYPLTASHVIRQHFEATYPDTQIVGESYFPLGRTDFVETVREILSSEADVVVNMIDGDSNVHFYDELSRQGVSARDLPVIATSIGEDELRGLLPEVVEGHFAAWNYFQSLESPINRRLIESFQLEHGEDRVMSDPMEAAYVAVQLWKQGVESAGSADPMAVRDALRSGAQIAAPSGNVSLDPRNQHLSKRCRVGRIRADRQFDIVFESSRMLGPDPFPQDAFPGWRCDWTGSGLVEGPAVEIKER